MSDSVRPHRRQPTRLLRPWDSPGKNTGVGFHFLLQCSKVKSQSEVAQSCLTPSNPMDCSLRGSSVHGIFQAGVLEWGAIAFSNWSYYTHANIQSTPIFHFKFKIFRCLSTSLLASGSIQILLYPPHPNGKTSGILIFLHSCLIPSSMENSGLDFSVLKNIPNNGNVNSY